MRILHSAMAWFRGHAGECSSGAALVAADAITFGNAGRRPNQALAASKPYVRWWWLAGPFPEEAIVRQLEWVKANGFGGVELAWLWPRWIGAAETSAPGIEWLGREWIARTRFVKQQADGMGLGCDFTFGSSWPFGGAGVTREHAAQTLTGLSPHRLELSWQGIPDWFSEDGNALWVLNHLRVRALEHYASTVLRALAPALAGSTSSLFCDSLELDVESIWTSELWTEFSKRFGYRLEGHVRALTRDARIRYDYRCMVADTMLAQFFEPYTRICNAVGAKSRVQCHGSLTDLLAAYGTADIPESEAILFPSHFSRIAASSAAIEGKPLVSCETFTCLYGAYHWDFRGSDVVGEEQIADMKLLADAVFAEGVNMIVWHGMPFNGPEGKNRFLLPFMSDRMRLLQTIW